MMEGVLSDGSAVGDRPSECFHKEVAASGHLLETWAGQVNRERRDREDEVLLCARISWWIQADDDAEIKLDQNCFERLVTAIWCRHSDGHLIGCHQAVKLGINREYTVVKSHEGGQCAV